jgi:hypothetical protein
VNVKDRNIRSCLNNIYPALRQAKFEFLKNHQLARGFCAQPFLVPINMEKTPDRANPAAISFTLLACQFDLKHLL